MTPKVHVDPAILEPLDKLADPSKRSTVIFLHGLGDDGHGTGYGLAQQFQRYQKLRYTRWVLPTAPIDPEVGQRCWYKPHALPSALKPRVPGREDDTAGVDVPEDEEGLLRTVAYIDELVKAEVDQGTQPGKIAVGGFSQGCAASMVWGLKGEWKDKVAGVFGLSGYLPNINAVSEAGKASEGTGTGQHARKWFFGHGMGDALVSISLFAEGQERLQQYVQEENIEGHIYQDLGHDVGTSEIRDLWLWIKSVLDDDS